MFFTNSEGNHKIIRDIIYNVAIINKEFIKPFFLTGLEDDILADHKLENYIERIKNDGLYAGIIEISLATIIFNYTIIIYSVEEELSEKKDIKEPSDMKTNKDQSKEKKLIKISDKKDMEIIYKHLSTIEKQNEKYNNLDEIIVLLYDRNIKHFSLILTNIDENNDKTDMNIESKHKKRLNIEDIDNKDISNYIKGKTYKNNKIKFKNGEFYEDLNIILKHK